MGGFDGCDECGEQVQDDGRSPAAVWGAWGVFEGAGRGPPGGAGAAVEGAGAGCAAGLLERVGRLREACADEGGGVGGGDGQEVAEGGDVTGAPGASGTLQQDGRFPYEMLGGRPVDRAGRGVVAVADPGQGQVVGERFPGEPDRAGTAVGAVAGQRDRVPDQGSIVVVAFADAQALIAEPVQEIRVAGREGGGVADGALEGFAGGLRQVPAVGFRALPGGRGPARGPVARRHRDQAPRGLEGAGGGVHADDESSVRQEVGTFIRT